MNWRKPAIELIDVESVIRNIAIKASSGNTGIGDENDCLVVYGDQGSGGGTGDPGIIPPPCIPGPFAGCNDASLLACAVIPVFSIGDDPTI